MPRVLICIRPSNHWLLAWQSILHQYVWIPLYGIPDGSDLPFMFLPNRILLKPVTPAVEAYSLLIHIHIPIRLYLHDLASGHARCRDLSRQTWLDLQYKDICRWFREWQWVHLGSVSAVVPSLSPFVDSLLCFTAGSASIKASFLLQNFCQNQIWRRSRWNVKWLGIVDIANGKQLILIHKVLPCIW